MFLDAGGTEGWLPGADPRLFRLGAVPWAPSRLGIGVGKGCVRDMAGSATRSASGACFMARAVPPSDATDRECHTGNWMEPADSSCRAGTASSPKPSDPRRTDDGDKMGSPPPVLRGDVPSLSEMCGCLLGLGGEPRDCFRPTYGFSFSDSLPRTDCCRCARASARCPCDKVWPCCWPRASASYCSGRRSGIVFHRRFWPDGRRWPRRVPAAASMEYGPPSCGPWVRCRAVRSRRRFLRWDWPPPPHIPSCSTCSRTAAWACAKLLALLLRRSFPASSCAIMRTSGTMPPGSILGSAETPESCFRLRRWRGILLDDATRASRR